MKGNLKGKIKKSLTGTFAGILAFAMLVPATMTTFAADTVCHIGEVYYATLAQAYSAAKEGDTIVIDDANAGTITVSMPIKIDAGTSGYDLKNVTSDGDEICSAVNGTVKSFAKHGVPAKEGGVIFNWDTSKFPEGDVTATVTFKDENGHTTTVDANVNFTGQDPENAVICTDDVVVTFAATCTYLDQDYSETKDLTVSAIGHDYVLVDDESGQGQWWDGASYDKSGHPILKDVKVQCANEDDAEAKDATVEFVEAVPDKDNAPTCQKTGKVTYTYKVLYAGNYIKTKDEKGNVIDATITIVDESAPATGVHVKDESKAPILEFKTYSMAGDKFLDAAGKAVSSKDAAEVIWTDDQDDPAIAKAFELDGVLTYRLAWDCKEEAAENYNFKDAEQTSAGTSTYYLADDTKQAAKTDCTAYAVTKFEDVVYTVVDAASTSNGALGIDSVTTEYEPLHGAIDTTKPGYSKKNPTHTTTGLEEGVCSICGQHVEIVLPTVGEHTFTAKAETKPADCTNMGYTYQICDVCAAANVVAPTYDAAIAKEDQLPESVLETLDPGAIVTATTPALDHHYILRNAEDVSWDDIPANVNIEKNDVTCTIHYICTRCDNTADITYHLAAGTDTLTDKYSAITAETAKATKCTEFDKITFTVNDEQAVDLDSGKGVSTEVTTDVIGPHSFKVSAVNFSADGKSVNVSAKCANDKCPDAVRTFAATSTASVDAATGLTTYTASITDENLATAEVPAAEIDTTIPAEMATKQLYDLSAATVEVPDYTEEEYADKSDKDVVVKIGDVTVDPKFYTVSWPEEVIAPKLDAEVSVAATTVEDKGITANGNAKATFKVTQAVDKADKTAKLLVNGTEEKEETEFAYTYNGKENTFVATTEAKDAVVSYKVAGKAADAASFKDAGEYTFTYSITYADGTVYTSDAYSVTIEQAEVKITKKEYTKAYGADDPEIAVESGKVFEGDDLGLKFEEHAEEVGTYTLEYQWTNDNYYVLPPTTGSVLDRAVLTLTITATEDTPKYTEAEYQEAVKAAEEAKAAAEEAKAAAEEAQKVADEKTAAAEAAQKAADEAKAAAEEAQAGTTEAKAAQAKAEEAQKAAETKAAAAEAAQKAAEAKAAAAEAAQKTAEAASSKLTAPAKVSIKKPTAKKKALIAKWAKVADANGYEIQIATNKKFTKNLQTVTVKKGTIVKKTIKKLKSKKKYFVRVRAYKTISGGSVYGQWSAVKKVKTK